MDQSKHKILIVFLVSLLVLAIVAVFGALFWGNKELGKKAQPSQQNVTSTNENTEKPITYTQEDLQKALDKPLEQTEANSQTPVNKEEEQKQLQEALAKPASKEEATNYTQEELESALRK